MTTLGFFSVWHQFMMDQSKDTNGQRNQHNITFANHLTSGVCDTLLTIIYVVSRVTSRVRTPSPLRSSYNSQVLSTSIQDSTNKMINARLYFIVILTSDIIRFNLIFDNKRLFYLMISILAPTRQACDSVAISQGEGLDKCSKLMPELVRHWTAKIYDAAQVIKMTTTGVNHPILKKLLTII